MDYGVIIIIIRLLRQAAASSHTYMQTKQNTANSLLKHILHKLDSTLKDLKKLTVKNLKYLHGLTAEKTIRGERDT